MELEYLIFGQGDDESSFIQSRSFFQFTRVIANDEIFFDSLDNAEKSSKTIDVFVNVSLVLRIEFIEKFSFLKIFASIVLEVLNQPDLFFISVFK